MRTTLETDENGDRVLIIPPELLESGLFLEDDKVSFHVRPDSIEIKNLSCLQMRVSRFKRNLNGILKNSNNDQHPLNRVLVKSKNSSFWVIPYDKNKQRAYFREKPLCEESQHD